MLKSLKLNRRAAKNAEEAQEVRLTNIGNILVH